MHWRGEEPHFGATRPPLFRMLWTRGGRSELMDLTATGVQQFGGDGDGGGKVQSVFFSVFSNGELRKKERELRKVETLLRTLLTPPLYIGPQQQHVCVERLCPLVRSFFCVYLFFFAVVVVVLQWLKLGCEKMRGKKEKKSEKDGRSVVHSLTHTPLAVVPQPSPNPPRNKCNKVYQFRHFVF